MAEVTITNSTISGLHVTKKSAHSLIELEVVPDLSRQDYDRNCLKVVCPELGSIPSTLKSCMKPREGVNPGTHFLIKPRPRTHLYSTRSKPGASPGQTLSKNGMKPGG